MDRVVAAGHGFGVELLESLIELLDQGRHSGAWRVSCGCKAWLHYGWPAWKCVSGDNDNIVSIIAKRFLLQVNHAECCAVYLPRKPSLQPGAGQRCVSQRQSARRARAVSSAPGQYGWRRRAVRHPATWRWMAIWRWRAGGHPAAAGIGARVDIALAHNAALLDWLRQPPQQRASLCSAAFLLAGAGLLDTTRPPPTGRWGAFISCSPR